MLNREDNEILVRTGAGTAMGEYFRRYWLPVALSRELPSPDCAPIRVKVMGEELVAFRDTQGRVGLIEPGCAHRGTNLFFGRNEENGLRCVHHGWKFDVTGKCVDMPNVPPHQDVKHHVKLAAYPVTERYGLVWIYMGGRAVPPPFPDFAWTKMAPDQVIKMKAITECRKTAGWVTRVCFKSSSDPVNMISEIRNPRISLACSKSRCARDHGPSNPRYAGLLRSTSGSSRRSSG